MTINDFDESKKPTEAKDTPQEVKTPEEPISGPVAEELTLKAIADSLDIKSDDSNYTDELDWIMEYAKDQATDNSLEALRWAVRDLEIKLGSPPLLGDRVKYMARYAFLFMEGKRNNSELQKMTRGVNVSK